MQFLAWGLCSFWPEAWGLMQFLAWGTVVVVCGSSNSREEQRFTIRYIHPTLWMKGEVDDVLKLLPLSLYACRSSVVMIDSLSL